MATEIRTAPANSGDRSRSLVRHERGAEIYPSRTGRAAPSARFHTDSRDQWTRKSVISLTRYSRPSARELMLERLFFRDSWFALALLFRRNSCHSYLLKRLVPGRFFAGPVAADL